MCSSTRGPAIAPSFVTWPIRNVGTPDALATRSSRAAASRTWLTLPGAASTPGSCIVWMESTMATAGASPASVADPAARSPELLQGVPGPAVRALAGPPDGLPSTLPADERDAGLRHGVPTLPMVVAVLQVKSVPFLDARTLCERKRPGDRPS